MDDDRWSPHVYLRLAGAGGAYRASPVVYEINDERGIVVYVGQTGGPVLLDTDGSSPPRAGAGTALRRRRSPWYCRQRHIVGSRQHDRSFLTLLLGWDAPGRRPVLLPPGP